MSLLGPRDIVDIAFDAPEGWYDVELLGESGSDDWPERLAAALEATAIVPQLRALQQALHAR